jgi:3-methyladenine DNA glycosylase AlkD
MNAKEILEELESLGTAQNRKIYRRHGAKEPLFGVSYANLKKLVKRIKINHGLAQELWASGNHDARVLATSIADPERVKSSELDAWVRGLDDYIVTDAVSVFAGKTSFCRKKSEKWIPSKKEWICRAGWKLLARLADADGDLDDEYFEKRLETIEKEIHSSRNRVKDAMNMALICIGTRNPGLEKKALAAAKRIGKVEVDHGETGCKTPDAAAYIRKVLDHRRKKKR